MRFPVHPLTGTVGWGRNCLAADRSLPRLSVSALCLLSPVEKAERKLTASRPIVFFRQVNLRDILKF